MLFCTEYQSILCHETLPRNVFKNLQELFRRTTRIGCLSNIIYYNLLVLKFTVPFLTTLKYIQKLHYIIIFYQYNIFKKQENTWYEIDNCLNSKVFPKLIHLVATTTSYFRDLNTCPGHFVICFHTVWLQMDKVFSRHFGIAFTS